MNETKTSHIEEIETASSEITVFVDNIPVTALVDTGADYSVMSGSLAAQLRNVTTEWNGPQIHTADGYTVFAYRHVHRQNSNSWRDFFWQLRCAP